MPDILSSPCSPLQQRQAVFNQAVAVESTARKEQKTSLKINCSTLNVSLKYVCPLQELLEHGYNPFLQLEARSQVLYHGEIGSCMRLPWLQELLQHCQLLVAVNVVVKNRLQL